MNYTLYYLGFPFFYSNFKAIITKHQDWKTGISSQFSRIKWPNMHRGPKMTFFHIRSIKILLSRVLKRKTM